MKHIDEWLDEPTFDPREVYAKFVLDFERKPAWWRMGASRWMARFKLFCRYEGRVYRVMGASRLGDVWLSYDLERKNGYDRRVDLAECSDWSDRPELTEPNAAS